MSRLDPSSAGADAGSGPADAIQPRRPSQAPPSRGVRKLILCFDGTGNKFHGDDSDSNILKIFRMLDRQADDQYHYYQPGIGTYVHSASLSHTSLTSRLSSWYLKAKDSAIGSNFDQHVVGGYRFLMRFYNPGDEIYIFGFSRGSYIARFLAEMIDHVGLLSHGNEEMVKFAWKAFAQWQSRQGVEEPETQDDADEEPWDDKARRNNRKAWERYRRDKNKEREMYLFMKNFRETFSRPVGRIQFLGLFDTVNSVPRFEGAWMGRSTKFPYTATSSARVIRHAVSIDERRAKFRQDLMYQGKGRRTRHRRRHRGLHEMMERVSAEFRRPLSSHHQETTPTANSGEDAEAEDGENPEEEKADKARGQNDATGKGPLSMGEPDRAATSGSGHLKPSRQPRRQSLRGGDDDDDMYQPYRARACSRSRPPSRGGDNASILSGTSYFSARDGESPDPQDIDEVWFSGGHGDVGGGWQVPHDRKSASHVPLVWMVREAIRAGLPFDPDKTAQLGCGVLPDARRRATTEPAIPKIQVQSGDGAAPATPQNEEQPPVSLRASAPTDDQETFQNLVTQACTAPTHDSLRYGNGLGFFGTTGWKIMEYLPFRRMDLREDGTWAPIRWPLPLGEVRDVPDNVRVHGSVIHRMIHDDKYRPGNLILGGGGRGKRVAPREHGMGEWVCVEGKGDPVGEIWVRKHQPSQT